MSKEVKKIEEFIPTLTNEQTAQICREISAEKSKPPTEKKSFGELFRDILDGLDISLDKFITVTDTDDKTYYRYRSPKNNTLPRVETLIKLCIGLRLHRDQIDYLFALTGQQIKPNDPNYDTYQYYFDFCSVKKELTVMALLEEISLSDRKEVS